MGLLKWALIGGAGYLGFKALSGGSKAVDPFKAVQTPTALLDAMRAKMDPNAKWDVTTFASNGYVHIQGISGGQKIDKTFPSVGAALAWVNQGKPTGEQAAVNWQQSA